MSGDLLARVRDQADCQNDLILIAGKQENCERTREALQALVRVMEEEEVPLKMRHFIADQKGWYTSSDGAGRELNGAAPVR